jgi:hypothetical protein
MADFGSMSADQINSSMGMGPGGAGALGQAGLNSIFGNFGQQTDYYSNLGAAFGRNTGGFGDIYGGGGFPQAPDPAPPQPPAGAVDWGRYFTGLTAPAAAQPPYNPFTQYGSGGYNPFDPSSFAPSAQQNIGGSYGGNRGGLSGSATDGPAPDMPAPFGGADTNLYGYPGSGSLGTMNAFGGYSPGGSGGGGGIGSDALRDRFAWQLAQSSPYATPGPPANGPYANLGYNPGMQNYFAFGGGQPNFQDRFGMGFPGAAQPSQYTGSPYTNVQGQTFQPNLPQGFAPQFDANTPGGALNPGQLNPGGFDIDIAGRGKPQS